MRLDFNLSGGLTRLLLLASALPILGLAQTPVKDVENPAHSPLRFVGGLIIHQGHSSDSANFYIPQGKRFVAEYLNVKCTPAATNPAAIPALVEVQLATRDASAGITGNPLVAASFNIGKNSVGNYVLSTSPRLYGDHSPSTIPDIQVTAFAESDLPGGHAWGCSVLLSGYTVDVPVEIRIP